MQLQSLPTGTPKVFVAMSGGVDSSVAAALLKRAGFNVTGVFMKFWSSGEGGDYLYNRCCSPESEERARRVAKLLGIPFYVLNFKREFKKKVVDYFLREYKRGLTPNPCVVCNKEIKFGLLLEKALALEADFIATGHYARISSSFKLLRGRDKEKDQSYFLWQLSQKQLSRILFPVGGYTKKEVRKLAEKFGLPVSGISESQEVCFIPKTVNDFLAKHLKQKRGSIVDTHGKILGQHQGLAFYTIGQRKGIGLAGGPFWVLGKHQKRNILVVTKNEKDLLEKELFFGNTDWLSGKPLKFPLKVKAKIRYRSNFVPATIYGQNKVVFGRPQRAITPGQSVVFYRGEELLGGGIIL